MIERFVRFCAGGVVGFGVQLGTLAGLLHAGVHYLPATLVSIEAAIVSNFLWHRRYTFPSRGAAGWTLLRYNLVAAASTWVFKSALLIVALAGASPANAAEEGATLQPKTLQSFVTYAFAVEQRAAAEIGSRGPLLAYEQKSAEERTRLLAMLRRGEVFVERGEAARDAAGRPLSIDGGSVHHWRGTVFVPNVSLDELLRVLQEPQTDRHKQEDVLSSRVIARDGNRQKVFLRLRRTRFVTVVYDTEYDVDYRRLAPDRAVSTSLSTRIAEIEHAGTPQERALPEGQDHGYMWRLNSYWRYQQVPGGVMVQVESLTLSRDLPAVIGPLITPIVNSTARESMARTLASVRARFTH